MYSIAVVPEGLRLEGGGGVLSYVSQLQFLTLHFCNHSGNALHACFLPAKHRH